MQTAITDARWFTTLVSDCKQIIEEAKLKVGKVLIKAKYDIGNRILPDYEKFGRQEDGYITQDDLAEVLETSQTNIRNCINFAKIVNKRYGKFTESIYTDNT